jgi:hypothetical protein
MLTVHSVHRELIPYKTWSIYGTGPARQFMTAIFLMKWTGWLLLNGMYYGWCSEAIIAGRLHQVAPPEANYIH